MERKLVKQGRNALTVTIPAKWSQHHNLSPGDTVNVIEKNNELMISTRNITKKKEITLNLKNAERSHLFHLVHGRYVEGYDSIIVFHNNPKVMQEIAQTLLGMIIETHTETKTVFKNIIAVPEENFNAVLRRATYILLQQARTLFLIAEKKAKFADIKVDENLLDFNLLYCLRYLNKYETFEHAYKYFLLCATIESAGDQITEISKFIKTDIALAKLIVKNIDKYIDILFKKDFQKLYNLLRKFRNNTNCKTFAEGITYALAENLYNNIGYLADV